VDQIRLKIGQIVYADPESGYVVARGTSGNGTITAVGILPDIVSGVDPVGTEYVLEGRWETSKYGRQFHFTRSRVGSSKLFHFLSKVVKGLGEKLSRELIDCYGEEGLVRILEEEPDRLLEFKGIKEKKLEKISSSWRKHRSIRELSAYLLPNGVTPALIIRIHNCFGDKAPSFVRKNPYVLTEVRGIGFKRADEIALKLGVDPSSDFRLKAAIVHVLNEAAEREGHTWLDGESLWERLLKLLNDGENGGSAPYVGKALNRLESEGKVRVDKSMIALAAYRGMEEEVLSFLHSRSQERFSPIAPPVVVEEFIVREEKKLGFTFSKEQKDIIRKIGTGGSRAYALCGYAGTGKTTIARAILEFLSEHFCEKSAIVSCAFTGMASSRVRNLTGFPAYTIHSLLRYRGGDSFDYDRKNKLPYRVILLDEASMVNLPLFRSLIRAIPNNALFIMVGDPAQLPPIGPGNVFGDIIEKGLVTTTTLTTIFRQDPRCVLAQFANIIRHGEVPRDYRGKYRDFHFIEQDIRDYFALREKLPEDEMKQLREENNEQIYRTILRLAGEGYGALEEPVRDFQVLTPMRKGVLGTESLNTALQELFNRNGKNPVTRFGLTLKEGDKAVHLKNRDMDCAFQFDGRGKLTWGKCRVFNGSVGIITKIDHENEEFIVSYPERMFVKYDFDHIGDLVDLAYCLTVHKAQGSQYRWVVIPMSNSHYIMLNNKWLYTAVTRAKEKVFLVGQHYAFKQACKKVWATRRSTFLGQLSAAKESG